MSESEFIGMVVIALVTLIGLFFAIYRPLNENTKAMTTLTVKVEELTKQINKQDNELKQYKEHMSESQRRQWETINKHTEAINKLQAIQEHKED